MFKSLIQKRSKPSATLLTVDSKTLHQQLQTDNTLVVLDVRTADEYAKGHIGSARLLPLTALIQRQHEIPQNCPVVVTCRSGARSRIAAEQLMQLGFTNIINHEKGLFDWQHAGLPIVQYR